MYKPAIAFEISDRSALSNLPYTSSSSIKIKSLLDNLIARLNPEITLQLFLLIQF